jgi:hypothetical protein
VRALHVGEASEPAHTLDAVTETHTPADDAAAQHEAEYKAAALYNVSWESGAGASIWARVVEDELARHEATRERYGEKPDRETWDRLHGTAFVLVVAIDQVLKFEHRVRRLTGDAELQKARVRFDAVGPDAEKLRELVAHLDDYAVGKGHRQTGRKEPPLSDQRPSVLIYWGEGGSGTVLSLGDQRLNLREAADAAVALAHVVESVGAKHLARVEKEANAALRRRFGLPPEEE